MKLKNLLIALLLILCACRKEKQDAIIVGTSPDYPPFTYIENSEIKGFDIDLIKTIASRIDKNIELRSMEFDLLLPEIQLGNIHLVVGGMTATPERCERVFFSDPYLTGIGIVALSEENINNLQELKNKKIIVNEGYIADDFITKSGFKPIRVSSVSDALFLLNIGQADVFVSSSASLYPYLNKLSSKYKVSEIDGIKEDCSILFSKKYLDLANLIQKELIKMEQDGTLNKLKQKWGFA